MSAGLAGEGGADCHELCHTRCRPVPDALARSIILMWMSCSAATALSWSTTITLTCRGRHAAR